MQPFVAHFVPDGYREVDGPVPVLRDFITGIARWITACGITIGINDINHLHDIILHIPEFLIDLAVIEAGLKLMALLNTRV